MIDKIIQLKSPHECLECGHESNEGKWVGELKLEDGTKRELIGIVSF